MQSWAVNQQINDLKAKSIVLNSPVGDDELERFSGVVQSLIIRSGTTAAVSGDGFDVFVKGPDGIERLCTPADRVQVSVGHHVSVINLKLKNEPPRLLYLANHTTRQEYRPDLRATSPLVLLVAVPFVVALILFGVPALLMPKSWLTWLGHSKIVDTLSLCILVFASGWLIKFLYQAGEENRKKVTQLVASFADEEKSRERVL